MCLAEAQLVECALLRLSPHESCVMLLLLMAHSTQQQTVHNPTLWVDVQENGKVFRSGVKASWDLKLLRQGFLGALVVASGPLGSSSCCIRASWDLKLLCQGFLGASVVAS